MVSRLTGSAVILLVAALSAPGQEVAASARQSAHPPQGARVKAQHGDTIVIEGDDEVHIIHRKPAYVRIVADGDRASVVVLAEYVKTMGDIPAGVTNKSWAFYSIEGHTRWPVSDRWEGHAWLEEYSGSTAKQRRPFLLVETSEGDIAFGEPDRAFPYLPARPTTFVAFRGVNMGQGANHPFDLAEQQIRASIPKSGARQPIRK